jgi:CRISPR-associated protein Cas1
MSSTTVSPTVSADTAISADGWRERGKEFAAASERWHIAFEKFTAADKQKSRTLVLTGYGASLSVRRDCLIVADGCIREKAVPITLYRGVHNVSRIILADVTGSLTFDALQWCREQHITILVLNYRADVQTVINPDGDESDAVIRRAQYMAHVSGHAADIARHIVWRKIQSQATTLRAYFPDDAHAADVVRSALAWLEMSNPPTWLEQTDKLLSLEGRTANAYFDAWKGFPLRWHKPDLKKIPPHWLTFTGRASPLAPWENARHAVTPMNATLNYAYALLEAQVRLALIKQGFDPACGFLHVDRRGHQALVYDLMECHRAQVDALVVQFFKRTVLRAGDFIKSVDGACQFHPSLARYIVASCRIQQPAIDTTVREVRRMLVKDDH